MPFKNAESSKVHKVVMDRRLPTDPEFGAPVQRDEKEECIRLMKDCRHKIEAARPSAAQVADRLRDIIDNIKEY